MKKRGEKGTVSRRDFIKGIGIGAGALTLGQFSLVEAALLPKAAKTERYNVVVVGTGLAGLSAAAMARTAGASVVVLEKMPNGQDGGNSKIAGGAICLPPDRSKAGLDAYYEDFMKKSQGKGNADISRVIADNIFDSVDWLKACGVEILPPLDALPYRVKTATVAPAQFAGMPAALGKIKDKYLKAGGKIVFRTKAKQLIMDNRGRVIGVRAAGPDGRLVDYMGEAVVVATGGYAGNREILETFVDPNADEMMVRGTPWATGDGMLMAHEAGAEWVAMGGLTSLHVAAVSTENSASGNPSRAVPFCLGINRDGSRYVNESLGYVAHGKAALKQPGQKVALVFDEEIKKKQGVQISWGTFNRIGVKILEADTLEELAKKIDVPPDKFVQTIADFNAAVQDGKALSAKPPKTALAFKVEKSKFYAFYPLVPGITLTFGGIRINGKGQALEADGTVIPGLYACGETAGGVYYDDYFAGASLCNCLVMGRICGKEAAALAKAGAKKTTR
jgi:flavocytochrome c